MDDDKIYARLTNVLKELLGHDEISLSPSTVAGDVEGWDSFNHLNIIVAVETEFGIRIGVREIDSLKTVGDLVRAISRQAG